MSENEEIKVDQIEEPGEEPTDDNTDWKAEALKARGIAKRNATRLAKLRTAPKVEATQEPRKGEQKNNSFDYGKAVFLENKGIVEPDDISWAEKMAEEQGKNIYELFQYKWFREEVKERKQAKETREATPSGTKRAGTSTKDSASFWVAKGELPPNTPENRALRSEVLKLRIETEKNKSHFTDHPIV